MEKYIKLLVLLPIILLAVLLLLPKPEKQNKSNIYTENGKQIIEITAKGGYTPADSMAKANTDTILRINTQNTFDCSSSLVIPTLNIQKNLGPNTKTDIPLGTQRAGTTLYGLCSMGMYKFDITFN